MKRSANTTSLKGLYDRVTSSIAGRLGAVAVVAMVLVVVAATGVGVTNASAQSGNTSQSGGAMEQFSVKQGNNCYTVTPLGNESDNVVSFYNYRGEGSGYSSRGTSDLQIEDTSQFFFYKGNGGISLVMLHDRFTGNASTGGGAVTLEMQGLPVTGGWTVKDDGYAGSNDTFQFNESVATASWSWGDGRSDGGVYQANPSAWDSRVKIIPRFNRESAAYPDPEWDGEETGHQVQRWIVRSGDGKAHALNLYEPVVIEPGACGQSSNQQGGSNGHDSGSNGDGQMDTSTDMGTATSGSDGSSNQTEATGPGFGIGLTVFALAAALIAILRRR